MNTLSTRTKLMISLAIVLFGLFLFAESRSGKSFVMGQPTDQAQGSDDDQPAGLHPIIFCAIPSGVLLLLSFVSYKADRRRVG
jgi:hypothetical protein